MWMYDQVRNLLVNQKNPTIAYGQGAHWIKNLLKFPTKSMVDDPVLHNHPDGNGSKFTMYTVHHYVAEALENVLQLFPEVQDSSNYGNAHSLHTIMSLALGATVWQFHEKKSCINQNIRNKVVSFYEKTHNLVRNKAGNKKQKVTDADTDNKIKTLIADAVEQIRILCIKTVQQWMDLMVGFQWDSLSLDKEVVQYVLLGFMFNKVPSPPPFLQMFADVAELDCSVPDICNRLQCVMFDEKKDK